MPSKTIRFDYFRVRCARLTDNNVTEIPIYELHPLLDALTRMDVVDRTYNYRGELARLQVVNRHRIGPRSCWELQLLRLRQAQLPGIANDDGEYEIMELEDDEYVGEEVSVLYDEQLSIMVIQRNRNSLSPSGIEEFLNLMAPDENIRLEPIIPREEALELKNGDYIRSFNLSIADIREMQLTDGNSSSIREIVASIRERYNAISVSIKISLGQRGRKSDSLTLDEVAAAINDCSGSNGVTRMVLAKKDAEDARVEVYDLIDKRVSGYASCNYDRECPITHTRVFPLIAENFRGKVETLENILA